MQQKTTPAEELFALAAVEGIELPLDAETIVALEQVGCTVDLETGDVYPGGDQQRYRPTAQALNLVLAVVLFAVWLPLVQGPPVTSSVRCEPGECRGGAQW